MGRRKGVGGTERRYDWAYHVPRIINHISEGGLLAEYLRGEDIPRHTFYTRLYNDRELYSVNGVLVTLMEGYRKAELIGIEAMIDDAVSIADREPRCYGADRRVDAGEVLWAEKRSAIRLKVAGMRNPEKYGNRVGIEDWCKKNMIANLIIENAKLNICEMNLICLVSIEAEG